MIRRLTILLLIVGCDNSTEPEDKCSVELADCHNPEDYVLYEQAFGNGIQMWQCEQTYTNTGDKDITFIQWEVDVVFPDYHTSGDLVNIYDIQLPPGESFTKMAILSLRHTDQGSTPPSCPNTTSFETKSIYVECE